MTGQPDQRPIQGVAHMALLDSITPPTFSHTVTCAMQATRAPCLVRPVSSPTTQPVAVSKNQVRRTTTCSTIQLVGECSSARSLPIRTGSGLHRQCMVRRCIRHEPCQRLRSFSLPRGLRCEGGKGTFQNTCQMGRMTPPYTGQEQSQGAQGQRL